LEQGNGGRLDYFMSESKINSNSHFGDRLVMGALTLGFAALVFVLITSWPHLNHAVISLSNECINNLRLIDEAKQEWASETHHGANDTPTIADLTPFLKNGKLEKCPSGGTYTIGKVGEPPTCSLGTNVVPPHVLP
jgi:hypothetical protein